MQNFPTVITEKENKKILTSENNSTRFLQIIGSQIPELTGQIRRVWQKRGAASRRPVGMVALQHMWFMNCG